MSRQPWREEQLMELFEMAQVLGGTDWYPGEIQNIITIPRETLWQTLNKLRAKGIVERDSIHGPYRLVQGRKP